MKCLIPVLALSIFIIQIHAIFLLPSHDEPCLNKSFSEKESLFTNNNNSLTNTTITPQHISTFYTNHETSSLDKHSTEETCSEFIINCLCKCGLAFMAGVLISDARFIKFGVL